jgi:4-alpha-glucanotransferase
MWSIFQIQDLFAMNNELRIANPHDERINIPGDPNHYWRYRMHLSLEDLIKADTFNTEWQSAIKASGR